jgi:alpha-tubulin suppressor-like RCC1 family protein
MMLSQTRLLRFQFTVILLLACMLPALLQGAERLPTWRAISSGGSYHTCALAWSGSVYCWGTNFYGELGNTNVPLGGSANRPVMVEGLSGEATAIAVGGELSCAILSNGSVQCWGDNEYGQIGNPQYGTGSIRYPVNVLGLGASAISVSIGLKYACAVLSNGTVSCWGENWSYAFGTMSVDQGVIAPPTLAPGVTGVSAVSAGDEGTCAILTRSYLFSGEVSYPECWGSNADQQLGVPPGEYYWMPPTVDTSSPEDLTSIAMGEHFACAISQSKGVLCWGSDGFGQLGDDEKCAMTSFTESCSTPQQVKYLGSPVSPESISVGEGTGCVVFGDGSLWCWGDNSPPYSKLGIGDTSTSDYDVGVHVPIDGSARAVAVGFFHVCALTDGGNEIQCWGLNTLGELGNGTYNNSSTPSQVY